MSPQELREWWVGERREPVGRVGRAYDPRGIIPMVELPGKIPVVLPVILTLSKLYRVEYKVLS